MSEQPQTPAGQATSTIGATPSDAPSPSASWSAGGPAGVVQDRPEIAVGAAFAGGFVLALILKRIAS